MFSKKFALVLAGLFAFVNCDAPVANHENSHHVRRQRHHHHRTTTQQTHTDAPHAHVATPHVEESHAHDHADNQLWEKDPNCAQWNSDRRCVRCAAKSYWDDGRCRQSSPTCKTFNEHNGACLTCFGGYQLQAGKCVVEQARQIDPLCHQFNEGHCTQCSRRAYFGKDHRCVNANPLCNTFDRHDGCCLSCYAGYRLNNGTCVVDPDFKGVRHVDEESHHQTEHHNTEHHNTQAPRVEVTVERTRQRRHRNSSQQRNRRQRQHHHSN